jgi:hypothetical protein
MSLSTKQVIGRTFNFVIYCLNIALLLHENTLSLVEYFVLKAKSRSVTNPLRIFNTQTVDQTTSTL